MMMAPMAGMMNPMMMAPMMMPMAGMMNPMMMAPMMMPMTGMMNPMTSMPNPMGMVNPSVTQPGAMVPFFNQPASPSQLNFMDQWMKPLQEMVPKRGTK
jgi:hypothetical protein